MAWHGLMKSIDLQKPKPKISAKSNIKFNLDAIDLEYILCTFGLKPRWIPRNDWYCPYQSLIWLLPIVPNPTQPQLAVNDEICFSTILNNHHQHNNHNYFKIIATTTALPETGVNLSCWKGSHANFSMVRWVFQWW